MHRERFGFEYRASHLDPACAAVKHLPRRHHQTAAGDHPELDSRAAEDDARDPGSSRWHRNTSRMARCWYRVWRLPPSRRRACDTPY